ncbi:PHP domain-containing protein [Methanothermococcus okinawensis]|uniref:PHP domain protein n=1 Tax=Methanothermococcus okinawensis (strain DSM 14208 / JCM 11175 / IH1) TaxID=647113 RepID=F8AMI3_METOI|nr:PHP domain-containing protein [Methanothermococcus okinawensis]AEH06023.1 PHP domain protein [Methanothermococcus okinawensis IH1]
MENKYSKADLHIHSKYSGVMKYMGFKFPDSVEEPRNIMKYAKKKGLDVIAVTDHNTIKGGLETKKLEKEFGIDVVVGSEIMTKDGEVLGLYLNEEIPKGLSAEETIEMIHEQNGLAVAPHPYSPICKALGDKIFKLNLDGVEVFNAYHRDGIVNNIALKRVMKNYYKKPVAFLGNSDGHIAKMVGNGYTTFEGINKDDVYDAIVKRKTSFDGAPTPLWDIILWSYKVVYVSEKALIKSTISKNDANKINIRFYKKLLAMFGGLVYVATPLPIVSGILGNYYLKRKAKNKLKEVNSA